MSAAARLVALARPRLMPFVMLLPLMGWAWAHWDRALAARGVLELAAVMGAWGWLHAGTMWLNAAVDRDEGEVLLGRAVEPPPGTAAWGYAGLVVAVGGAAAIGGGVGAVCAMCAALSILYSHPQTLWKSHPLGGPFVNVLGYGVLSPLAGWLVVGVSGNPRTVVVWGLAQVGILAAYYAAQAFQQEEDQARGYRTLVATHGPATVLRVARACLAVGFLSGLVLAMVGWIPRMCLLGVVGWWVVDRWIARWAQEPGGGDGRWAAGFANRMAFALILGISLAFAEYAHQSLTGKPVAGLGTASGIPVDRPILPPNVLRAIDASATHPR